MGQRSVFLPLGDRVRPAFSGESIDGAIGVTLVANLCEENGGR